MDSRWENLTIQLALKGLINSGRRVCFDNKRERQMLNSFFRFVTDLYSSTNPKHWMVTLGEHRLNDKEVFEQVRGVKKIYLHPMYKSMFMEGIYDTPPDFDIGEFLNFTMFGFYVSFYFYFFPSPLPALYHSS
mgnify:CR=1 FL=1